jgi:hypothetical protein
MERIDSPRLHASLGPAVQHVGKKRKGASEKKQRPPITSPACAVTGPPITRQRSRRPSTQIASLSQGALGLPPLALARMLGRRPPKSGHPLSLQSATAARLSPNIHAAPPLTGALQERPVVGGRGC